MGLERGVRSYVLALSSHFYMIYRVVRAYIPLQGPNDLPVVGNIFPTSPEDVLQTTFKRENKFLEEAIPQRTTIVDFENSAL